MGNRKLGERLPSLDHFRGLALFLMIIVNSLSAYDVPSWLKHAPWSGYRFPDLVAPMFLFAMGVAYRISLGKRLSRFGLGRTILHFARRYVLLFLFGFVGILIANGSFDWGILQMLGSTGLFALPLMFTPPAHAMAISFLLLAFYQIALTAFDLRAFVAALDMGGPFATLSWCFVLVFSASLVGTEVQKERADTRKLFLVGLVIASFGFLSSFLVPLNKHLVSFSYILFSTGLATLVFTGFYFLVEIKGVRIGVLNALGKNSLSIFILSSIVSTLVEARLPASVPVIYPILITLCLLFSCIALAKVLDRLGIYIKL
jgi:predicted acyltransferase